VATYEEEEEKKEEENNFDEFDEMQSERMGESMMSNNPIEVDDDE